MLYPSDIKIQKKKNVKNLVRDVGKELKRKIRYLIANRTEISQIILVKLHI